MLALRWRDAVVRVVPYGCITIGQRGCGRLVDFAALAPEVVGFSDDGRGVQSDGLMEEAMRRAAQVGKPVVAHCEVDDLLRGGYIHDGAYAKAHGHRGICSESEWRPIQRDLELVRETGCGYHVCHISTKESVDLIRKLVYGMMYGDLIMWVSNQVRPYEVEAGAADAMVDRWTQQLVDRFQAGKGMSRKQMRRIFDEICADFATIPVTGEQKVRVGIVGEIYVKYSPLGNNNLEQFLHGEDCEVNLPGLMGFVQYCAYNPSETARLYGGTFLEKHVSSVILDYIEGMEKVMIRVLKDNGFHAPLPFQELVKLTDGVISTGNKMGEGWLLTAEMIELVRAGYENIVCAQPFGCLPNHICGKGMINKIRELYPQANITPIDYDPSATRVNQENRIKLMLAVAKERLNAPAEAQPLTAEQLAGGAPQVGATV